MFNPRVISSKLMSPKVILLSAVVLLLLIFVGYQAWRQYQIDQINQMTEDFPTAAGVTVATQAKEKTLALNKLMAEYRRADGVDKINLHIELTELAKTRQAILAELVQSDPAAAIAAALPEQARANMPAEIQALVEQKREIEGELEVNYEDYVDHSRLRHILKTENARIELLLPKQANTNALRSGAKLQASGWLFQDGGETIDALALSDEPNSLTTLDSSSSTLASYAIGQRNLLLVEVYHPDYNEALTSELIENVVLNQANQYFQEASYNQLSLVGDITSAIMVNYDKSVCNTTDLATKADDVLRNQGYLPEQYDHVMYFIPYYGQCGWAGKGNIAGPKTWIKQFSLGTIIHELGHNLGLYHANAKECGAQTTNTSNCSMIEYGDLYSVMGGASETFHFNTFHKEQLGWLNNKVVTLTDSGSVTLGPTEVSNSTPNALKVLKNTDSNGNNNWYYIDYRQAIGFDSRLGLGWADQLHGIRINEGTDNSPNSSYLLDATPDSLGTWSDFDDASILPGESYIDETYGIEIAVISSNTDSVSIDVSYTGHGGGSSSCVTQSPAITALSSNATNAVAGDTISFNYQVSNNDNSSCGDANFEISTSLPVGWGANLTPNQFSLSAGELATVTLHTTLATSTQQGTYNVATKVQRSGESAQISAQNTVQVIDPDTTPDPISNNEAPVALSDTIVISNKSAITFNVLANDYDSDGDSLQVIAVTQGSKGSVSINIDNSLTYVPAKSFKSNDNFTYTITDSQVSRTTTVNVELQSNTGGDESDTGGKGNKRK